MDSYFDELAKYSNNNFYSKDTIGIQSGYGLPQPDYEEKIDKYFYPKKIDHEFGDYYLFRKSIPDVLFSNKFDATIEPDLVLEDYWSRLSTKAVMYGAGVINLFHKQAEEAITNKEFSTPTISFFGELMKLGDAAREFFGTILHVAKNSVAFITNPPGTLRPIEEEIGGVFLPPATGQLPPILQLLVPPQGGSAAQPPSPQPDETPGRIAALLRQLNELSRQLRLFLGESGQAQLVGGLLLDSFQSAGGVSGGGGNRGAVESGNVNSSGGNSGSGVPPPPPAASAPPTVNHIVISETQVSGIDAGDEFIELYNPTSGEIDLSSWSIQSLSGGATSTAGAKKKHFEEGNRITPKGYFLIARRPDDEGRDGYRGAKPADLWQRTLLLSGSATGTTIFLVNNQEAISGADDPNIVDRLAYGSGTGLLPETASASLPTAGQSMERKAFRGGMCVSSQGNGEFLGNGCDTDSNISDFEIRALSNPQNSQSLPEPREAPAINNFQAAYSPAPRVDFSWGLSSDAAGSTSTVVYAIHDISNASSITTVFEGTATTSHSFSVNEVGRSYDFEFTVRDRDGFGTSTTTSVFAPSFLDAFYFYRDPRPGRSGYLLDVTASVTRPFWDLGDTGNSQNWKLIVAYLNHDAPKEEILYSSSRLRPSDPNFLEWRYRGCNGSENITSGLLIPYNRYSCQSGGMLSSAFSIDNIEDRRFAVPAESGGRPDFSPTDYVTLAFYDFAGGGGGEQRLGLAAVDRTEYRFRNEPPAHASPTTPGNFAIVFDSLASAITFTWSNSTDSDTLDRLIAYEVNYTTSSAFSEAGWRSVGADLFATGEVIFGNSYLVGVRAVDDFGNASEQLTQAWNFPFGYAPLPSQTDHSGMIGLAEGGAGQRIFMPATSAIDGVAMWIGGGGGGYGYSYTYLEIYRDASGVPGDVLAASGFTGVRRYDSQEVLYVFPGPVELIGNTYYWLVPQKYTGEPGNYTKIYGSQSDPYPDGFWSANPGFDAYFRMRRAGE